MGIEETDVRRIASLAGLDPSPDELKRLEGELAGILAHMELLAEVPLDEAGARMEEGAAPLRRDEPGADGLARPVREMAPDWNAGFFSVPRLPALGEGPEDGAAGEDEGGGER